MALCADLDLSLDTLGSVACLVSSSAVGQRVPKKRWLLWYHSLPWLEGAGEKETLP